MALSKRLPSRSGSLSNSSGCEFRRPNLSILPLIRPPSPLPYHQDNIMISSTKAEFETRRLKTASQHGPRSSQEGFDWPLANEAEHFLRQSAGAFLAVNSFARRLADRMRDE